MFLLYFIAFDLFKLFEYVTVQSRITNAASMSIKRLKTTNLYCYLREQIYIVYTEKMMNSTKFLTFKNKDLSPNIAKHCNSSF